jgi:hypothetical protein
MEGLIIQIMMISKAFNGDWKEMFCDKSAPHQFPLSRAAGTEAHLINNHRTFDLIHCDTAKYNCY